MSRTESLKYWRGEKGPTGLGPHRFGTPALEEASVEDNSM